MTEGSYCVSSQTTKLDRKLYGQRGATGRPDFAGAADAWEEDAFAAIAAGWAVSSSISASTTLSSSSFSASSGATSRSFSAACCRASICFANCAYLACLRRKTSWMSFIQPPIGDCKLACEQGQHGKPLHELPR